MVYSMAMQQEPMKVGGSYHSEKGLNSREYPRKIWHYIVQYLHFRILTTSYVLCIYIYICIHYNCIYIYIIIVYILIVLVVWGGSNWNHPSFLIILGINRNVGFGSSISIFCFSEERCDLKIIYMALKSIDLGKHVFSPGMSMVKI